jgi:hypothetical protein
MIVDSRELHESIIKRTEFISLSGYIQPERLKVPTWQQTNGKIDPELQFSIHALFHGLLHFW